MHVYLILYRKDGVEEQYENKIYTSYKKALEDFEDAYLDYDKHWGIYEADVVVKEPKL